MLIVVVQSGAILGIYGADAVYIAEGRAGNGITVSTITATLKGGGGGAASFSNDCSFFSMVWTSARSCWMVWVEAMMFPG